MVSLSGKQKLFLFIFPFFAVVFMVISLLMSISAGFGPGDAGDPPITPIQETISSIGGWFSTIWYFPLSLLRRFEIPINGLLAYGWFFLITLVWQN